MRVSSIRDTGRRFTSNVDLNAEFERSSLPRRTLPLQAERRVERPDRICVEQIVQADESLNAAAASKHEDLTVTARS
jgi:hypothetical protein